MTNSVMGGPSVSFRQRGKGAPLVMLNGMAVSGRCWPEPWLERLERSFHLVLVDNRGTGPSRPPTTHNSDAFSMVDLAGDGVAVLDACGIGAAHMFGHSMGAMVALTLAAEHPGRVERLVVSAPSLGPAMTVPTSPMVLSHLATMPRDGSGSGLIARLVAGRRFTSGDPAPLAAMVAQLAGDGVDPAVTARQVGAMATFDPSSLARVQVPVLVIHGEADPLVPVENGRRLAAALPDAHLVVLPGVGHLVPYEAGPEVAAAVETFLAGA